MASVATYLVMVLIGVLIWANNLGLDIINLKRDWPVILIILGILGILHEIFKK